MHSWEKFKDVLTFDGGAKQVTSGNSHAEHHHKGTAIMQAQNPNLETERDSKGVTRDTVSQPVQSKQFESNTSSGSLYRRKLRSYSGGPVEVRCDTNTKARKGAKTIVTGFTNNRDIYNEGEGQQMTNVERCDLPGSSVLTAEATSESQNCSSERICDDVQKNNQDESDKYGENDVTLGDHSVEPDVENDEKDNFVRLTNQKPTETSNNPGGNNVDSTACENKVNSRVKLRKRPSTLTDTYSGNQKSSQKYRCSYKGCEKIPPFKDLTQFIVHTAVDHSDDENDDESGNNPVCNYKHQEIRCSGDQDDLNSRNEFSCKHKNCTLLASFKDFSDLIVHTETVHSDTEDEYQESDGQVEIKHEDCYGFIEEADLLNYKEWIETELLEENRYGFIEKADLQNYKEWIEPELLEKNQTDETISSLEKIFQDAWENSTAEAGSRGCTEANNGHTCPICNRVFERENERDLHVKLHSHMVHMCVYRPCGWTFQRYHELQWHYSKNHSSKESKNAELGNEIRSSLSPRFEIDGSDSPRIDENHSSKESKNAELGNEKRSSLSPRLEVDGSDSPRIDEHFDIVHSGNEAYPEGGEILSFNTNGIKPENADVPVVASTRITNIVGNDTTCSVCKRVFKYRKGYLSHVRNHDSMKYKCTESSCGWEFIDFLQLKNHYLSKHDLVIFRDVRYNFKILPDAMKRCPICSRQLLISSLHTFLTYDYHVQNHDKMLYNCLHQSCGWTFENFVRVRSHYGVYHKQDTMYNEEWKYRVKYLDGPLIQIRNSNAGVKEPRSEGPRETDCETVVDVIKCEVESDEVEFLSEVTDCTETGDSCETSPHHYVHSCESTERETSAKSFNRTETNGHQLQMHAKLTTVNSTSKSSNKCNKTRISRHSRLKYRCLHKKCVFMFKTFSRLKIHYQNAHREILQQRHRRKYLCRNKNHVSLESDQRKNNYKESTPTRKRHADEDPRGSAKKKRGMSDQCVPETFAVRKKSRNVREKSLSVIKQNRRVVIPNMKNEADAYSTRMNCPLCARELPRHVYKDHTKNHDTLRFRCSYDRCKWMFANYRQLDGHYRYEHHCNVQKKAQNGSGGRFQSPVGTLMQCPKCQRHLHKNQYDNHLLNHYQMAYRCSRVNCGWLFESESKLNAHCENHPDMRYKCVYAKCGYLFETSHQLCGHYYYKHKPLSEVEASQHRMHSEYLTLSTTPAVNKTSRVRSHREESCSNQSRSLRKKKRKRVNLLETKSTQTPKTMTKDSCSVTTVVSAPDISKSPLDVASFVRNMGNTILNKSLAEQNTSYACSRLSTNRLNGKVTSKNVICTDERNSESQLAIIESNAMGVKVVGTVTYRGLQDLTHCTVGSQTTPVKMELTVEPPIATEKSDEIFFQMS